MLISLVLTLTPTTTATVPSFLGRAAHAWFLDEVRAAMPDLAEALHDADARRPFTVSPLWCPRRSPQRGRLEVAPAHPCHLRITSLTPALTTCLTQQLIPRWPQTTLHLTGVPFTITEIAMEPRQHAQARLATYVNLRQQVEQAAPPDHITLDFLTPTTFRRSPPPSTPFDNGAYDLPLPLPSLIFGGLLALWNEFAPQPLPEALTPFLRDCVVISRYDLRTELVTFGGGRRGRVGGFVGRCRFAFRCSAPQWRRRVGVLAAFAPFAGIGWRTTMGLGQVRRV